MASRRGVLIALSVTTVLLAGAGVAVAIASEKPKRKKKPIEPVPGPEPKLPPTKTRGLVVCPPELGLVPPDTAKLGVGDFIVVTLASSDRKFAEQTWAQVRSILPGAQSIRVQLQGELGKTGIQPLRTELHGYQLGEKIVIARDCVFEILSATGDLTGTILCGVALEHVGEHPVSTKDAADGSLVQIVVANDAAHGGQAILEKLWVALRNISPKSPVLRGIVAETPKNTAGHGLARYSAVEMFRDCVAKRY